MNTFEDTLHGSTLRVGTTTKATFAAPADGAIVQFAARGEGKSLTLSPPAPAETVTFDIATADLPPGDYAYDVLARMPDGQMLVAFEGRFGVAERVSATGPQRTKYERMLAAAETALEAASGSTEISVSLEGISTSFEARAELLAYVVNLRRKVREEKALERLSEQRRTPRRGPRRTGRYW